MKIWFIIASLVAIASITCGVIFYTTIFPKMDNTEQKIVLFSSNDNVARNLLLYNWFVKDSNTSNVN